MDTPRRWQLRPAGPSDTGFLRAMLFEALYVPAGEQPLPDDIVDEPELRRYVEDFGEKTGDLGVVGVGADGPVGACWLRLFPADAPGYGWVDDATPELSIAVVPELRNRGLGQALIEDVGARARSRGVERVSLSVDARSPALRLYRRAGFQTVDEQGTTFTMARTLTAPGLAWPTQP